LTGWNSYEFDDQERVMPGHPGHTDEMEAPLTPDIHITCVLDYMSSAQGLTAKVTDSEREFRAQ